MKELKDNIEIRFSSVEDSIRAMDSKIDNLVTMLASKDRIPISTTQDIQANVQKEDPPDISFGNFPRKDVPVEEPRGIANSLEFTPEGNNFQFNFDTPPPATNTFRQHLFPPDFRRNYRDQQPLQPLRSISVSSLREPHKM
jgi:hypothetical protein